MSTQTQFYVSNMKCEGCATAVEQAVSQAPGFESATVDLAKGVASVQGDVDPQTVCQLLTEAGYPAVVKSDRSE